jgi:uncharacterized protein YlxP (DUF503 family)
MYVGTSKVRVYLHMGSSLKQKRSEVKRLLARIKAKVPVAYAEVGELDKWQMTELGFSAVSNSADICERLLDRVIEEIESKADAEVVDEQREITKF